MIVIMIVAHFVVKKGTRHVVRWTSGIAFVLAVVIIANMVSYGPIYSNVSVVLNGGGVELSDETVEASTAIVQELGEEGMVLVKNDGLLPLSDTPPITIPVPLTTPTFLIFKRPMPLWTALI